jgi:hypothetical protein
MNGFNTRKYLARAASWDLGETAKGGEQIAVQFEILTEGAEFGTITWHGYFTDKSWEITIKALRTMGWLGTDLSLIEGLNTNDVELVIEDETYDGQTFPKVKWVNRVGGLALKAPLSEEKRKAFAAMMRDKIKAFDATSDAPPPKQQPKAQPKPAQRRPAGPPPDDFGPPPMSDDDIPF